MTRPSRPAARASLALFLTLSLLGACGDEQAPSDASPAGPSEGGPPRVVDAAAPPPVEVVVDGEATPVWQGSYCWQSSGSTGCVDTAGPRPTDLVDVGSPESVELVLGVATDSLTASFEPVGGAACAQAAEAEPVDLGGGRFRLDPAGPAGRYRVTVSGRAEQGEVPGTFVWTTPTAGPVSPEARMSIVWEPHGHLEGQGFLFTIVGLAVTPTHASATVTATAGNGARTTFDAGRAELGCPAEGRVLFSEAGTARSDEVAALGPTPFTYDVELRLDDETFRGTGTYPEPVDTDPDNDNPAPVLLEWDPPLSSYSG